MEIFGEIIDMESRLGKNGSTTYHTAYVVDRGKQPLRHMVRIDLQGDSVVRVLELKRGGMFRFGISKVEFQFGEIRFVAQQFEAGKVGA